MKQNALHSKIVMDPLWGLIDIGDVLALVDTPQFQALGFKNQLGVASLVFPAATHTRKQHSFGAYHRAKLLADRWMHLGLVNAEEARLIAAYALLHDIGHGPFSHVVEDVTKELWGRDHDANGSILIGELRKAVEGVGISFGKFKKMFSHEDPLYLAVHDKNLGAEKLDYLSRDAFYTTGEVPGVEYLALHTYFIDGELVIDERAIDQAKAIQDFYVKMFKNVYLRKNSLIGQRLIQKMTEELVRTEHVAEDMFWRLTDYGLLGLFETARSKLVREYYGHFMARNIPRTAIAMRTEAFVGMERSKDKPIAVLGVPESTMRHITDSPKFLKPSLLRGVEKDVSEIAGVPEEAVLIVPPLSMQRFATQDIKIYAPGGKPAWLSQYFGDHFRSLAEEGKSYEVLRVCVFSEYRKKVSEGAVARKVRDYIVESAGK